MQLFAGASASCSGASKSMREAIHRACAGARRAGPARQRARRRAKAMSPTPAPKCARDRSLVAALRIAGPVEAGLRINPEPRRLRRFAFTLAHIIAIAARRAAPIDQARAIFGAVIAILPERFALPARRRPCKPGALAANRRASSSTPGRSPASASASRRKAIVHARCFCGGPSSAPARAWRWREIDDDVEAAIDHAFRDRTASPSAS